MISNEDDLKIGTILRHIDLDGIKFFKILEIIYEFSLSTSPMLSENQYILGFNDDYSSIGNYSNKIKTYLALEDFSVYPEFRKDVEIHSRFSKIIND